MTSLEIYEFRGTLQNYIASVNLPAEVKRLVLTEITQDLVNMSKEESMQQLSRREAQKGE